MEPDVEKGLPEVDRGGQRQSTGPAPQLSPSPPASPTSVSAPSTASQASTSPLFKSASPVRVWRRLKSFRSPDEAQRRDSTREREAIVKEIHNTPQGYPRLAAFLDSDENFMVYRRFGYIQSRLLIEKQNDLQLLEDKLDQLDCEDADERPMHLKTRRDYGESQLRERVQLLEKLEQKWLQYSALLCAAQKMTKLNKPTPGEYRSVRNWVEGENPVLDEDAEFVYQKEDLITLRPGREYAWLDASVERVLRYFNWRIVRWMFQSGDTKRKTDGSGHEVYYTRSRIERFVLLIITLMILVLLVVPIYVLYELSDEQEGKAGSRRDFECIGVLLVFTLAFSACISLFTRARRHEILAASAAYAAVLVVFIGNLSGSLKIGGG